ncbi:MAG: metal-sensing transcriptional repressor [Lachnospiraceae bacterium]|nr:metal-sensing transcriptional repressor [Lachnospiraceae bacterium]
MNCNCESEDTKGIRYKVREDGEKKALLTRLSRIEGQVRGIAAMVEENRYCPDILTQVAAVQAALNSFNKELLARHIKTCVCEDIKAEREEAVEELCELLKRLMK